MCRADDSEGWDVSHDSRPRARKEHKCEECSRVIRPGETYYSFEGKVGGEDYWIRYKACEHCSAASQWLITACSGWIQEQVLEELEEHWNEEYELRSWTLARLIVGIRRHWNDGRMPVPNRELVKASVPDSARA